METFTLHITCVNMIARDVASTLHSVADDVAAGETSGVIYDANGSAIGGWENAPEM